MSASLGKLLISKLSNLVVFSQPISWLRQGGTRRVVVFSKYTCKCLSVQGKRILFLECLLDKGFSHYLVLLLKSETLTGQGLRNLDAFALGSW
jgi:hypothetical protein